MPNLDKWIEAQLKKGYRKEQIKNALIRKGYPPEAVAEVDKITSSPLSSGNHSKKPVSNKFALTILIVVALFVVWLLAMPILTRQDSEIKQAVTDIQPSFDESVGALCSVYEEQKEDCAVAMKIVAETYGDRIQAIELVEDVWIAGIVTESGYIKVSVKNRKIIN